MILLPRMATANSFRAIENALKSSMNTDGFLGIFGARWNKNTRTVRSEWYFLIKANKPNEKGTHSLEDTLI
jgi:hypothetical protein